VQEIAEIKTADKAFRNDQTFVQLKRRWDSDFNLYRLKPYDAGKGYYSYTSNSPRILATRGISMVTSSKLIIRIPLDTLDSNERKIANNIERLLYGMLTLNDDRLLNINLPYYIEQLAWHAILRGGVAVRPYMYKNKAGQTIVDMRAWDLYNTTYQIGGAGTIWSTNIRTAPKAEVEKEYDVDIPGTTPVEVYDHWDEKYNGVFVNNQWLKEPELHGQDTCPVHIIQAGSMPPVTHDKYLYSNIHRGESIYSLNRLEYPMMNKIVSDYATIVRRGVKTPLGYWSAGAEKTLDEDIYQVEKGAAVALDSTTGEKIEPLIQPTMPQDAKYLVDVMSGEEQRGGLSHVALGELGFRLSGFAINQLVANISTVIEPFVVCVEKALNVSLTTLLKQYATGKYPALQVRGRDSKQQIFGYPEAETIKPKDIKGDWHPEIRLVPVMPKDDAQRYQLAHLARTDGTMSLDTIQDTLLGIDDPALEQGKMAREWADNLVINRLFDAYMSYVADGQQDKAENTRIELQRVLSMQAQQGMKGQGTPEGMSALGQESMGNPGVGVPGAEVGMSPEALPSEMLGGMPGGAMNAGGGG